MQAITSFKGEYAFLSNFAITANGKTVEHLFQASKTLDPIWQQRILDCDTPGQAKRMGRKAPLRENWNSIRIDVMRRLVREKFAQEPFKSLLLATGDAELIEGNEWGDTFWGVCRGVGENWLGKILMETRENLRKGERS